jgi:hypothetical protein
MASKKKATNTKAEGEKKVEIQDLPKEPLPLHPG